VRFDDSSEERSTYDHRFRTRQRESRASQRLLRRMKAAA
jgi:hypothetical protein